MRRMGSVLVLVVALGLPAVALAAEEAASSGGGSGISNFILLIGLGAVLAVGLVAARRNSKN